MTLTRWDPFRELVTVRDVIDRFFEEPLLKRGGWTAVLRGGPAVNMYEVEDTVHIEMALPGVKPEAVDICADGNTLTVKGEYKGNEEVKQEDFFHYELHYGTFDRTLILPATVDTDHISATFEDGILKLVAPKRPEAQPKRIEIQHQETAMG